MPYEAQIEGFAEASRQDMARLLMDASRAVNAAALAALDPDGSSGVRAAHIPVIAALDGDGIRVTEIAARVGHTRQSTTALVRDLAAAGVVRVDSDPADRRASLVRLTPQGAELCARATTVMQAREDALRHMLGDVAVDALRATLRRLADTSPA